MIADLAPAVVPIVEGEPRAREESRIRKPEIKPMNGSQGRNAALNGKSRLEVGIQIYQGESRRRDRSHSK